jgi:CDGSH-type Zn-finger protein
VTGRTRVQVIPNGPVLIPGPVRIEMPGGDIVESDRFLVAVCTCRRSKDYPMCDTSHRRCRPARAGISVDIAGQEGSENRSS